MNLDGDLIFHAGITRSGKTLKARQEVDQAKRLLVWDPKGKWAQLDRCSLVTDRVELVKLIRAVGAGPARIAFKALTRDDFDFWAETAFAWGCWGAQYDTRTNIVAEEIANVTSPNKAPIGFHRLISQGLEFGMTIHVLTQAPAESEKTSFRNRTLLRVFQVDREPDAAAMARELRVDKSQIDALKPLEYLERDRRTGILTKYTAPIKKSADNRPGSYPKWTEVLL